MKKIGNWIQDHKVASVIIIIMAILIIANWKKIKAMFNGTSISTGSSAGRMASTNPKPIVIPKRIVCSGWNSPDGKACGGKDSIGLYTGTVVNNFSGCGGGQGCEVS